MTEKDYPYDNPFARMMRAARAEAGWDRHEAARHLRINYDYLRGLETGNESTRKVETLHRIADVYGLAREQVIALAPKTNVRTVRKHVKNNINELPPVRDDRNALAQYFDPDLAEYYNNAADRLMQSPDDVYIAFELIPPDMIAWLRKDPEHIRALRKLIDES